MKGYVPSEEGHVVNILPPVDISGGKTGQVFHTKGHSHVTLFLQIGVSAAAFTKILVNQCTDNSGSNATPIPFAIYKQEQAGTASDVLSARTQVAAGGYTPSGNDGIFYIIELDTTELADGSEYVQLQLTNGANSVIASAIAMLSGARNAGPQSPSVTT